MNFLDACIDKLLIYLHFISANHRHLNRQNSFFAFQVPPLPPMSTILPQNQNNFQQQHLNIFKQDFNSENSLSPPQNDFSSRPTFMTGWN